MKFLAPITLGLFACTLPEPPATDPGGAALVDASFERPGDRDASEAGGDEADAEVGADAAEGGMPRVLSQTSSSLVQPGSSIACIDEDEIPMENSYLRVFDLAEEGIDAPFHVTKVGIGVEIADGGNDGVQTVDVVLHTLSGELRMENLTQVATVHKSVPNTVGGHVDFGFDATVPAGAKLVVQVHSADGHERNDVFFMGANGDGQSAPGYLWAPPCGDDPPVDFATIGFPDMHIVIEVTGE